MKIRKLAGLLLATAMTVGAMMPAASAAPADFSINGINSTIRYNQGECEVAFKGDAMTLTVPAGWTQGMTGAHTMWNTMEAQEVDITQLPYLCWDVSGDADFDIVIRFAQGDKGLVNLQQIMSRSEPLPAGKGSVNFYELLKNQDVDYDGGVLPLVATVYRAYGDPGASATFNKLYFSATELKDEGNGDDTTTKGEDTATTTKGDDSTTTTTTAAKTTAKPTTNPSTGEATPVALAVLAVAAVGTVVFCAKKRA